MSFHGATADVDAELRAHRFLMKHGAHERGDVLVARCRRLAQRESVRLERELAQRAAGEPLARVGDVPEVRGSVVPEGGGGYDIVKDVRGSESNCEHDSLKM